ncbi:MAG: hypothetical protein AB7I68_10555 [Porticoccaceae bacterium]
MKRETMDFPSDSPLYTKRFAYTQGRRCRNQTISSVAKAGTPGPKRIGIDEISIKQRHTYRIVVSDLERG